MTLTRCLTHVREISSALTVEIGTLSETDWEGATNCPPWTVRDLCTHMVTSGHGFVAAIRSGLAGSTEPIPRAPRDFDGPQAVAQALTQVTREFLSLYNGLTQEELETVSFHRRGNRSVRWYAYHRLAELAFHGWDLHTSLGRKATLDEDIAQVLLPTLLESNVPRTYAAGLSAERGNGEQYLFRVGDRSWLVIIRPDRLEVTRGGGEVDVTIAGPAATVALLVYGRTSLSDTALRVEGDSAQIKRFARIFPVP